MIAVDVETSGIDPRQHSLLSIGAVDMQNPDNRFYGECRAWEGAAIEDEALNVNGFTREQIAAQELSECELVEKFMEWVRGIEPNKPIMCGQNVSFDRDFIRYAAERCNKKSPFNYRVVDIHSVAWFYISMNNVKPPMNLSLNRIMEMTGAGREPDPHNALTGAMCAAEVISRMLTKKSLFPGEFGPSPTLPK